MPDAHTADPVADQFEDDVAENETDRSRMSFLEHLDELRRRIIYSLYSLIVGCAVAFSFLPRIVKFIMAPIVAAGTSTSSTGKMLISEPSEGFMFNLKIGLLAGVIFASPFMFMQLWLFVAPKLFGHDGLTFSGALGVAQASRAAPLRIASVDRVGEDLLLEVLPR